MFLFLRTAHENYQDGISYLGERKCQMLSMMYVQVILQISSQLSLGVTLGTVYQVSTKLKLNQVSQRIWTSRFVATIDDRKKWCASVFMKQVSFSGTTYHIFLQFRNKRLIFRCTRRVPLLNDTSKKRNVINTPPWASRSKHFFTLCGVSVKKDKLHIFFRNSNENVKV